MFSDNDNLKPFVKEDFIPETEMDPPTGKLFFYNLIDSENVSKLMNDSNDTCIAPLVSENYIDYSAKFEKFITDWDSKLKCYV